MASLLRLAVLGHFIFYALNSNVQAALTAEEKKIVLDAQNKCRKDTDADPALPALTWDDNLANFAQTYTKELADGLCGKKNPDPPHTSPERRSKIPGWNGTSCGENLGQWVGMSAGIVLKKVADAWCNEKIYYNITTDKSRNVTGHYRQVVSQVSKKVGCGFTACKTNSTTSVYGYVICTYGPGSISGRPYLHGPSFDCSPLKDEEFLCDVFKQKGKCENDPYIFYKMCIVTCDGCNKLKNGNTGATTSTSGQTTTTKAPTTTTQNASTPWCTTNTTSVATSDGGKIETSVYCYQNIDGVPCKEVSKITYDANGNEIKYEPISDDCKNA